MEFTQVKRNMDKVRYANISVRVTDDFMRAVERNADHQLLYESDKAQVSRTIPARELWHQMIAGAHGHAEPGLIFWDTVKRWSTSEYDGMEVATTNPCSEIPLEPYGNCNLSNINLSQFVLHEFTARACINWPDLERAARYTTRFLDNLIDYNADKHPLPPQREASLRGRRIGVGFTGLADMLIKLGLRYDTPAAIEFTDAMFDRIKNIVYDESANLAGEKGPFPAFDRDRHLQGAFISTLHTDTLSRIQEHGLRNVALLTVPPVGSGAVLAGTTSGIEPIFALSYTRRSESLSQKDFQVYHPLVAAYMKRFHLQDETRLPPIFVTAHHIRPEMRVRMQAAIQKHIDHSISSTVNLPEHATFEDVERIYFLAWQAGLKGITVYREGSREGILVTADTAKPKATPAALLDTVTAIARQAVPSIDIQDSTDPAEQIEATVRALAALASQQPEQLQLIGDGDNLLRHRPERLDGATYRVPTGFGTAFITITEIDGEPFEVFARLGKAGSDAEADAEGFGRLCSTLLRLRGRGTGTQRLELIAEQLEGIGGSRWHGFGANRVRSLPDAIAVALRKHLAGGQAAHDHSSTVEAASTHEKPPAETGLPSIASNGNFCPRCQQRSMVAKGGCIECRLCGFREC
jgi:ribonucleoside-diphosphate reductase alpha chain